MEEEVPEFEPKPQYGHCGNKNGYAECGRSLDGNNMHESPHKDYNRGQTWSGTSPND